MGRKEFQTVSVRCFSNCQNVKIRLSYPRYLEHLDFVNENLFFKSSKNNFIFGFVSSKFYSFLNIVQVQQTSRVYLKKFTEKKVKIQFSFKFCTESTIVLVWILSQTFCLWSFNNVHTALFPRFLTRHSRMTVRPTVV